MRAWERLGFAPFPAADPGHFWPEATRRWALRFP
jgi:glutamyl-Q tRNA(Asp) synthetase